MARSRKRYSRAQIRARVRRPKRRGGAGWFYGAVAAIVAIGVVVVWLSVADRKATSDTPPQPGDPATGAAGDHWHAAFAANICGEWLSNPPQQTTVADNPNVGAGLHTHDDGFIHIEPATKSEGGDNATLGKFLDYMGWVDTGDSLSLWTGPAADPSKKEWSNGDKCPAGSPMAGRTGVVKWSLDCKARTDDQNASKLANSQVISLGFLPKQEAIGIPPNANGTPNGEGATLAPLEVKSCGGPTATTLPGATSAPAATDTTTAPTTASSTP
jgi:hypothetical protein